MPAPAIVMNDRIMGLCATHVVPGPVSPIPSPAPLPFSAPLTTGLCQTVQIHGKAAAVMGASGYNTPPHVGLADPFAAPTMQQGRVVSGSMTVMFGGQPAANATSTCTMCAAPGQLLPTVADVLVA